MATPFFQDLFYIPSGHLAILTSSYPDSWLSRLLTIWSSGHPAFWSSSHPDYWPSGLLAIWSSSLGVIQTSGHLIMRPSGHPFIWLSSHPVIRPSGLLAIPTSCFLSRFLKNVLIGIFLAYLIVGYTNLKFLMSSLTSLNLSHTRKTEPKSCSSAAGNDTGIS